MDQLEFSRRRSSVLGRVFHHRCLPAANLDAYHEEARREKEETIEVKPIEVDVTRKAKKPRPKKKDTSKKHA
mgnify:CR=1 FL=1